jgi:hypothetical protein
MMNSLHGLSKKVFMNDGSSVGYVTRVRAAAGIQLRV